MPTMPVGRELLRFALGPPNIAVRDAALISDIEADLPLSDGMRAMQVARTQKFDDWLGTSRSAMLLVHWKLGDPPKVINGFTALSMLCASLGKIAREVDEEKVISLTWFCGKHADSSSDTASGKLMITSLAEQLVRQFDFSPQPLEENRINFRVVSSGDLEARITALESLVRRLPKTKMLLILIDSVHVYDREEMDALRALAALLELVADDRNVKASVKLLFTASPVSEALKDEFQDAGLLLQVDEQASGHWASEDEQLAQMLANSFRE